MTEPVVEFEDTMPPVTPSSAALSSTPKELEAKALKFVLDHVLCAIRNELRGVRNDQVQGEKNLQSKMTIMDDKLNQILQHQSRHRSPSLSTTLSSRSSNSSTSCSTKSARVSPPVGELFHQFNTKSPREVAPDTEAKEDENEAEESKADDNKAESHKGREAADASNSEAKDTEKGRVRTHKLKINKNLLVLPKAPGQILPHAPKLPSPKLEEVLDSVQDIPYQVSRTQEEESKRKSLESKYKEFAITKSMEEHYRLEGMSKHFPKAVRKIVLSPLFDNSVAVAVVFNCLLVGLQVNHEAVSDESVLPFVYAEYFFILAFTVELIMRLGAFGKAYYTQSWAVFDVMLVLLSWVDLGLMITQKHGAAGADGHAAKVLMMIRLARLTRVLRMSKLLAKVQVMANIIIKSFASLFWLFCLIAPVVCVFATWLTLGATHWQKTNMGHDPDNQKESIRDAFGTVPRSLFTLFQSVTGGVTWGDDTLLSVQAVGVLQVVVFCFFIVFCLFSVLNMVTGLYVDGVIQQANEDRAFKELNKTQTSRLYYGLLMKTLAELDADGDGFITKSELSVALCKQEVKTLMSSLGVEYTDAAALFHLLNDTGDDLVSISDFVQGMETLKGAAQGMQLHQVLHRVNLLITQMRPYFSQVVAQATSPKGAADDVTLNVDASGKPLAKKRALWP